nr:ribonuclease H-like domain-containing protein [Tanacetum cinerariifolium]
MINVFNNSSKDFLEDLFSNQPSGNPIFLSHPELTSPEVQDDVFDSEGGNVLPEKLLDLDSTKDLHPPLHVNPFSGSTTYSSFPNPLLEEFANELALITFPPKDDDYLRFDIESDLKEIEFLLHQDIDSSLKDLIDQKSKLLIDELDLPCDFLPPFEYDSFISQDFSRVDALPSTNNEDKVFNPGILTQEKSFEIITRVVQDKKLATSNASLVLEDFDPPFYELLFFKEVPRVRFKGFGGKVLGEMYNDLKLGARSKCLWQNMLHNPSDEVIEVLKRKLNIDEFSTSDHCEVSHKEKDTKVPFPLSDQKYVHLGQLVHFDV